MSQTDLDAAFEAALSSSGRPALLALLKRAGVESLSERQATANRVGRQLKARAAPLEAAAVGDVPALEAALASVGTPEALETLGGAGKLTPLMAAAAGGHARCVELLLTAGARPGTRRSLGLTALALAAIKGHDGCVCALLAGSASPLELDEDGWSPLALAALHGHAACVRSLLLGAAQPGVAKPNGFTCLMAAAVGGSEACCRALLDAGADPAARSARGWTAADYARGCDGGDGGDGGEVECGPPTCLVRGGGSGPSRGPDSGPDPGLEAAVGGRHQLIFSDACAPGHSHDESWRERPARKGRRPLYYRCSSAHSHDSNCLQVLLRAHGLRTAPATMASPARPVAFDSIALFWLSGQPPEAELLASLGPHQRINRFPGGAGPLSRKTSLWRAYRRAREAHGREAYDYMPETYVLPEEASAFEECMRRGGERRDGGAAPPRELWIVKPAAARCGSGIRIHDAARPLPAAARLADGVASRYAARMDLLGTSARLTCDGAHFSDRYIHPPYLIGGRKFDLRLYVLVTRWSPLTCYWHESGIVRFACEPYSLDELAAPQVHLTNYAVNKGSRHFVASVADPADGSGAAARAAGATGGGVPADTTTDGGDGSIWSLVALRRRLAAELGEERTSEVWRQLAELIVKTLDAAAPAMAEAARPAAAAPAAPAGACFQLYGFDVMLDGGGKPWLLEVNGDPGLRTESPIFLQINRPMLLDMLNLVGVGPPAAQAAPAAQASAGLAEAPGAPELEAEAVYTRLADMHVEPSVCGRAGATSDDCWSERDQSGRTSSADGGSAEADGVGEADEQRDEVEEQVQEARRAARQSEGGWRRLEMFCL